MSSYLTDRGVLITGGAGAFGTAFVGYALAAGARRVLVYSTDEEKHRRLKETYPDRRVECLIGDVRDQARLRLAFEDAIDCVIHAAALKQVPACEHDPFEAIETNVRGSMNVVLAARAARVSRVVMLSTDKAAAPTTTYGKTKALAEAVVIRGNTYTAGSSTRFAVTRYGNVIGSTGSVVPMFLRQQAAGGPLTVTDIRSTRFWMSLDVAVALVAWTLEHLVGGEIVVPKIPSARVVDVAHAVAADRAIDEIGLRPTEKLHEILITDDEVGRTYDCGDVYLIVPVDPSWPFQLPANAVRVPADFRYASDVDPQSVRMREVPA